MILVESCEISSNSNSYYCKWVNKIELYIVSTFSLLGKIMLKQENNDMNLGSTLLVPPPGGSIAATNYISFINF